MNGADPRLDEFIRLFNEQDFFEAHEVLEELWIETEGRMKDFYKGLIQCAVAFVHLSRGNYRGANKLSRTALGYLQRYLPECQGINSAQLFRDFSSFFLKIVVPAERAGIVLDLGSIGTPRIHHEDSKSF